MGLLFAKFWSFFNTDEHKILIIGLDNAGKTTIMYQYLLGDTVHTSPTIGSNVEEIKYKNTQFVMWDLGGQESLRASWNTYYANTQFIILVVDSTDQDRLPVVKEELCKILAHDELAKASLLVLANKQDVKSALSSADISRELNLTSLKRHHWRIQACCALTGEGLNQGMEWICDRVRNK
ncbi:ADP-ribosylation factor-like protein 5B isoform X2 [Amphibalanus amphitrite]|uniref:ADP-ribosylation factor-like protein 5B n=1 Tax=Amphibalanus amphitrite TaxID=1232801 RepID=UPI001C906D6D|nr:ADP-ribosylation factor-like protein 5B [Amphibalanus amphitrite]XP_043210632.1 ADP-ribosylation factor-like protein 5B isoform X2 [Amphibalanus amphitrite]